MQFLVVFFYLFFIFIIIFFVCVCVSSFLTLSEVVQFSSDLILSLVLNCITNSYISLKSLNLY